MPATPAPPRLPHAAGLWLALVAVASLSQFHRNSLGVIAPELRADLGLGPAALGAAGSVFFIATALAQIPLGALFDRFGPRAAIIGFGTVAVAGTLAQAAARDEGQLLLARFLLGWGCAANLMGAVALCAHWYPRHQFSMRLSWLYALSQAGLFFATAPLALASRSLGWRGATLCAAALTALAIAAVWRCVPPRGPDVAAAPHRRGAPRGLKAVLGTPGLWPVLAIHAVAPGCLPTVLGLWAGSYLSDVHGLGDAARAGALSAMAAAQLIGTLAYGPLDRMFGTRKSVVAAGAGLTLALLCTLAATPSLPAWLAIGLLVLFSAASAFGAVVVAHGHGLFPEHLAGRGLALMNIAPVVSLGGLPWLTGAVMQSFAAQPPGQQATAYRCCFAAIAAALGLGLACYLRSRDPGRA